jgi:hypothetical protein
MLSDPDVDAAAGAVRTQRRNDVSAHIDGGQALIGRSTEALLVEDLVKAAWV